MRSKLKIKILTHLKAKHINGINQQTKEMCDIKDNK